MSNGEPSDKTVDMLADDLLEESTRIVESKVDPEIDLNTGIYLAECAYFLDKKVRETGRLPKRWHTPRPEQAGKGAPREELDQIATEIKRLEARQRAIYAESLRAAEADKVVEDWVAETLAEPPGRRMQFPVTVHGIESAPTPHMPIVSTRRSVGSWVAVRPCGAEWKGKTLLGIYIGDVALYPSARWDPASKTLFLDLSGHNPGIYVPAAKRLVYGCESWWGVLKSPDDLKQITDDDINSIWYVQALKALSSDAKQAAVKALAEEDVSLGPMPGEG